MSAIIQLPSTGHEVFEFSFGRFVKTLDDDEFYGLCQENEGWHIEQTCTGDLIVMPGTGGNSGKRNARLNFELVDWAKKDGSGEVFDSSTIFNLPNGARRSPDAAWISKERWHSLSQVDQDRFPPLCPEFVVELRSRTDVLRNLLEKLDEYIENGAELGWLIDPIDRRVFVYRPDVEVEILNDPKTVCGEPLLNGFELSMAEIWD
jgi:Uma2 family endonuclease